MKLHPDAPLAGSMFTAYDFVDVPAYVDINGERHTSPVGVRPSGPVSALPGLTLETLSADLLTRLSDPPPEVLLIGTGQRQRFPTPAVLLALQGAGIGTEVMDSAAAARTYNLLAGEGRRVVAGFILPAA